MKKILSAITALFMSTALVADVFAPIAYAQDTDPVQNVEVQQTEQSMNLDGTLGEAISEHFDTTGEEMGFSCAVIDTQVSGNHAEVSYYADKEAKVVVGIYSDDGKDLIATGTADISKGKGTVDVTIETIAMPYYFLIKSYIVDANGLIPLSSEYVNSMYTEEIVKFSKLTADDFDEELVYKIDENDNDNFMVFSEGVVNVSESDGNTNTVVQADTELRKYVIENINDEISSLKKGQIFKILSDDGKMLIDKVSSISVNNGTATIIGEQFELEEAFQTIKIAVGSQPDISSENYCEEALTEAGNIADDINTTNPASPDYFPLLPITLSGSAELGAGVLKAGVEGSAEISPELIIFFTNNGINYLYAAAGVELTLTFSGQASISKEINFKSAEAPVIPYALTLGVDFSVELSGSVGGSVEFTVEGKVGFSAHDVSDNAASLIKKYDVNNQYEPFELTGIVGEVAINITIEPKCKIGFGIVSMDLVSVGINVSVPIEINLYLLQHEYYNSSANSDISHTCKDQGVSCLNGDFSIGLSFSPSFEIGGEDVLDSIGASCELGVTIFEIDFFIRSGVPYLGECGAVSYKRVLHVVDTEGNDVSGAEYRIFGLYSFASGTMSGLNGEKIPVYDADEIEVNGHTDSNGRSTIMFPAGSSFLVEVKHPDYLNYRNQFYEFKAGKSEEVIVLENPVKKIEIEKEPNKTVYYLNQSLDLTGGQIRITYENGKTVVKAMETDMVSGFDSSSPHSALKLTVKYGEQGKEKEAYFDVEVKAEDRIPTGIEMKKLPKTEYKLNEPLSCSGGSVNVYYYGVEEPEELPLTNSAFEVTGFDSSVTGTRELTVTYNYTSSKGKKIKKATYYDIDVYDGKTIESITVMSPAKTIYEIGEALDTDKGWIVVHYSDDTTDNVKMTNDMVSGFNSNINVPDGDFVAQELTVTYKKKTAHFKVYILKDLHTPYRLYWSNSITNVALGASIGGVSKGTLYNREDSPGTAKLVYFDGTTESVVWDRIEGIDTSVPGLNLWTMYYIANKGKANEREYSTQYLIAVKEAWSTNDKLTIRSKVLVSANVNTNNIQTEYQRNEHANLSNMIMSFGRYNIMYNDEAPVSGIFGFDTTIPGKWDVTAYATSTEYGDTAVAHFTINVNDTAYDYSENIKETNIETVSLKEVTAENVGSAADGTSDGVKKAEFKGLTPETYYNLYVMRSGESTTPLSDHNLLYIAQGMSDESGDLSFEYIPKEDVSDAKVFIVSMERKNIAAAKASVKDIPFTGDPVIIDPVITYDGKVLEKGKDYILCNDTYISLPGKYIVTFVGQGEYWGMKSVEYTVTCDKATIDKMTPKQLAAYINSFSQSSDPVILTDPEIYAVEKMLAYDHAK